MFKTKRRFENSTNYICEVESFDNVLKPLLSSHLLGEGVYGFEVHVNKDSVQRQMVSPSFFREVESENTDYDCTDLTNDYDGLNCYTIIFSNPSFLPLLSQNGNLLEKLTSLQSNDSDLYIQLLFKQRKDNWQEELLNQYEFYLEGNDFPSKSRIGRHFQGKMLGLINKIGHFELKRAYSPEIEQKLLDRGYYFDFRLMVKNGVEVDLFENNLIEILKSMSYFNEWKMLKEKNTQKFLESFISRRMSGSDVVLSESELVSIASEVSGLSNNKGSTNVHVSDTYDTRKESLVSILPKLSRENRQVDHDLVEQLPYALKKARAIKNNELDIVEMECGATVQRITFSIPKGSVYSDIKSKYEDIKAALGTEVSIIQGKDADTVTFLIPCKERDVVYLRELLENPSFAEFAENNPLPFVAGIDMYNQPVYRCLTDAPHLLVAGASNSGKSVFMNALLITLILTKRPSELRIFLIDPKEVEFPMYEGIPHIDDVITDMKHAVKLLDSLIIEMESRYKKFAKLGVRNIPSYNKKSSDKIPYIVTAIDEYNDLRMIHPEVEMKIERLGQKARAAGIHLIIATQRPDKEVMTGVIKTNLASRVSFKLNNSNEYRTVFGTGIPYKNLLGFGDGAIQYVGQSEEFVRFQAPVITLDQEEEDEVFERLKDGCEVSSRIELEEVKEEEPIDKLKKLIAGTGDTKIGMLREQLGIRINDVSDMMKQLVEEGWLKKEGRSYVIIADEDELDKWRE